MATVLDELIIVFGFKFDNQELRRFEQRIQQVRQRLNQLSRSFTIAGAAGAAALGFIGKAGLDTEEALLRTRAALDLTEDQMKTLREEALRVGSTLPLNTKDIVNAQLAYGKLGATFEEIIRDAPAIAGAAVVTGLQPEQVARYAQIVQNVFGGDINENLDVMLRLANRSAGNFQSFGEALQFSGQSAADAGLDFTTYVALLGGVSGAGRDVEAVSQGLVGMWSRLAKAGEGIGRGGKVVTEAFEGVGISMADVEAVMDGTAEGFVNLLALINDANLSTTQLTALLSTVAGDTYSASLSFAVQNPEDIRKLLEEAVSAPGEVVRQQEIILSGASGGLKQMLAMIDTLLNRLAELGVLKGIEILTGWISGFIGWLTKTDEEGNLVHKRFLQLINVVLGLVALLLPLGIALRAVSFALGGLIPALKFAGFFTRLFGLNALFAAVANSNFVVSLRVAAINLRAFNITMLFTSATARVMWASILGPVAALAAVGFVVYKFRRQLLGALKAVWKWVKGNWPLLAGILLFPIIGPLGIIGAVVYKFRRQIFGVFTSIKKFFARVWGSIVGIFQDHWDKALAILFPAVGLPLLIARNWGRIVDAVDGVWSRVNNTVRGWIDAMVAFISELPGRVLDIVKDIPGLVADAIRDIPGLGGAIKVFTEIADRIPFYAKGGIVPGPLGKPMLATVHGGEMILPSTGMQVLRDMFEGFRLGAAGLPTPPPGAATIYRQSMMSRPTVNMGDITININTSPGADSGEIAENVRDAVKDVVDKAISDTFKDIAHDFDGPIER